MIANRFLIFLCCLLSVYSKVHTAKHAFFYDEPDNTPEEVLPPLQWPKPNNGISLGLGALLGKKIFQKLGFSHETSDLAAITLVGIGYYFVPGTKKKDLIHAGIAFGFGSNLMKMFEKKESQKKSQVAA